MIMAFNLKRAYAQAFAVFIGTVLGFLLSFTEIYWVIVAALLVMQTEIGVEVRQGLQIYLMLLMTIILGTLLIYFLPSYFSIVFAILALCFSVLLGTWFCLFSIILFFVLVIPISGLAILETRVYALTTGAFIGIVSNLFIFPIRVDVQFRVTLIPMVNLYIENLQTFNNYFFRTPHSKAVLNNIKLSFFPVWVYASGLSSTFQPGHRHFLIMIERLGEIMLSLDKVAQYPLSAELIQEIEQPLKRFVTEAIKILRALNVVLTLNKLTEPVSDLKEEWVDIEKIITDLVPSSLEITDDRSEYFVLIALLENLKDLRITLIHLGNSLQTACASTQS